MYVEVKMSQNRLNKAFTVEQPLNKVSLLFLGMKLHEKR